MPETEEDSCTMRRDIPNIGFVSAILSSLSLFALAHVAFQFGLSHSVALIKEVWESIIGFLLIASGINALMEGSLRAISQIVGVDLRLNPVWKHLFVVLFAYVLNDIKSTYVDRRIGFVPTATSAVFGVTVVFSSCLLAGLAPRSSSGGWLLLGAMAAFSMYEVLKAPFTAKYMPVDGLSRRGNFFYYAVGYGSTSLLCAVLAIWFSTSVLSQEFESGLVAFLIFYVFLALRNLLAACFKSFWKRSSSSTWLGRFLSSGSGRTCISMMTTLALVMLWLGVNAGTLAYN